MVIFINDYSANDFPYLLIYFFNMLATEVRKTDSILINSAIQDIAFTITYCKRGTQKFETVNIWLNILASVQFTYSQWDNQLSIITNSFQAHIENNNKNRSKMIWIIFGTQKIWSAFCENHIVSRYDSKVIFDLFSAIKKQIILALVTQSSQ